HERKEAVLQHDRGKISIEAIGPGELSLDLLEFFPYAGKADEILQLLRPVSGMLLARLDEVVRNERHDLCPGGHMTECFETRILVALHGGKELWRGPWVTRVGIHHEVQTTKQRIRCSRVDRVFRLGCKLREHS